MIFGVLAFGIVCLVVIRLLTRSRDSAALKHYKQREQINRTALAEAVKASKARRNGRRSRSAELPARQTDTHVRTPWGWPGGPSGRPQAGMSDNMRIFTDRLVRQKQLNDAEAVSLRTNGSIRALLEDRYGRVDRGMTQMRYEKVKRPLLRDPSEPQDQLENLGTAEAERLRRKLKLLKSMSDNDTAGSKGKDLRYVQLKDIKQPWGW